jgi:hypothetical protein
LRKHTANAGYDSHEEKKKAVFFLTTQSLCRRSIAITPRRRES